MTKPILKHLADEAHALESLGLFKSERIIISPQEAEIRVRAANSNAHSVINLCANNYLGLANHPVLVKAAHQALDDHGLGMASVRFICGTQDLHKKLEKTVSDFLRTEDTILYSSCFDANGGLFETLLGEEDAVISDELNHASIIDGIRLCKAKRFRYKNNNMDDLETQLKAAASARYRLVVTDGVFSMDGIIANLQGICALAEKYNALVMVDDSHAVGFIGKTGAGTPERCGVQDKVDIVTGTFGKALGGASGGFTSGRKEIIGWLRQRSRPYLFSNTMAPPIVASSIAAIDLVKSEPLRLEKLRANAQYFRAGMTKLGFDLVPGEHPIVPVMLYDAPLAKKFADAMLNEGVYVIAFSYPVVPQGKARIRTQMSAAHETAHLDKAIAAFGKVGRALGVVK
ncbi:MAG: glycine C-acetyltransferase [Alphaproteobacteria bacterium]|nr:glycine C-acetyltransferase [Alphaproteobacteria bacterium]MDE2336873.1 glycine C-acetyltransferase [Alphaproteobacteria bacterium]